MKSGNDQNASCAVGDLGRCSSLIVHVWMESLVRMTPQYFTTPIPLLSFFEPSLIPPSLTRKNDLVNQVEFLELVYALATVYLIILCQTTQKRD